IAGAASNNAGDSTLVTVNIYSGTAAIGTPARTLTVIRSGGSWSVVNSDWDPNVTTKAPLPEGTYTAQAQQKNGAGVTGYSGARTFQVDLTPPSTTDNVPATVQSNNITVTLSATDSGA